MESKKREQPEWVQKIITELKKKEKEKVRKPNPSHPTDESTSTNI